MWEGTCTCACMWRTEVETECPLQIYSTLFLRQDLLLNLEITNLTRLAGQKMPNTFLLLLSRHRNTGERENALCKSWGLSSGPHPCTVSAWLNAQSP